MTSGFAGGHLTGAFRHNLRSIALMLIVLIYGSFGLSRLVSLFLDGIPSTSLTILGFEFLMSLIALIGGLFVFLPETILKRWLKPLVAFAAGLLLGAGMGKIHVF